ncbi:MAG TPA: hypothetical protein PKK78_21950 [Kouleothrix sp.]|uniref:DUF6796 family protein n=1 Tax=Kouleothrix sp. TaxID=2779161 RepID=UPI002CC456DA|nr:hypothetical protein [Kouleothrix sp.]
MISSRIWGTIGSLAALAAAGADLALQYTPDPAHLGSLEYSYFLDVSPERIAVGFYLGVIAILMQIAGFWQITLGLAPAGKRFAISFFVVASFVTALGAVFHAHAALLGLVVQARARAAGDAQQAFSSLIAELVSYRTILVVVLFVGLLLFSLWYVFVVGWKKTAYPRIAAVFNPLLLFIAFGMIGALIPPLRLVLLPAGINLANLLFFALGTLLARRDGSLAPAG